MIKWNLKKKTKAEVELKLITNYWNVLKQSILICTFFFALDLIFVKRKKNATTAVLKL